jgi:hypothetical protein
MAIDIGNQPPMVNMVIMDGIVMGPAHCAFEIVLNLFQMLMARENYYRIS